MVRIKYKRINNKYVSNWILCKTFYIKVELDMLTYRVINTNNEVLVEKESQSETVMKKKVKQELIDLGVEFIEEIRKRKC